MGEKKESTQKTPDVILKIILKYIHKMQFLKSEI